MLWQLATVLVSQEEDPALRELKFQKVTVAGLPPPFRSKDESSEKRPKTPKRKSETDDETPKKRPSANVTKKPAAATKSGRGSQVFLTSSGSCQEACSESRGQH